MNRASAGNAFRMAAVAAVLLSVGPAGRANADAGWGPLGRTSVVRTSGHVISRDLAFPLRRFDEYLRQGAQLTREELLAIHPNADTNALNVIEREIYLLQSVRSDRIDPYFAFRLGVLGQLVADVSAPMSTAAPQYRLRYFRDIEEHIASVKIRPSPRRLVDATYFPELMRNATVNDDTIEVDYRSGIGFAGLARASLPADATRCIDAVADVFYTIVVAPVSKLNVSPRNIRKYALAALEYYLAHDKLLEAEEAVVNVENSGVLTPDLGQRIGDIYFGAGHFELAIARYEMVVEADPNRREVAARISAYYLKIGQDAHDRGLLEDASEVLKQAVQANVLNEEAYRLLIENERDITARDAREEAAKTAIELAEEYRQEAQKDQLGGNYIQAMAYLREAETHYGTVTSEFPELFKMAGRGLRSISFDLKEQRSMLSGSVQRLSGSGFGYEARKIGAQTPGVEKQAFEALSEIELTTALQDAMEKIGEEIEALR